MPSGGSPVRRTRLIVIAMVAGLLCSSTPAYAKSPKPTLAQIEAAKKAEAVKKSAADKAAAVLNAANQTLRTLTSKSDAARALYQRAQNELNVATLASLAAAAHAKLTADAVAAAHRTIGKLAANAYIMGGGLTDIEPLLSSNGPQDLADRLSILGTLGAQNSTALNRYTAAEVAARAAKQQADDAKAAQQVATDKVAAAKKIADAAKAAQQVEVSKLQKVQDQLMKELASAKKVAQTPGQKKVWPDTGFKGRSTIRSTEAQRLKAVAYAKKQVLARKPYVWGAQGPNSFDCSGLVYAAYKSAGLGYPGWDRLNAALYSVATMHVKFADLVPGDLLFYSFNGTVSSIHHITIYAGNGMMWEANSRSKGLIYSNMYSVAGLMPFGGRV